MSPSITAGTEVVIGDQVVFHNWRGRLVRGPRRLAGRKATVIGEPDRDGDFPLAVDGKFYPEQLSPACLTVVRAPQPVVGFAPGAWDLFHHGHQRLLQRAAELCDQLIVGVASDAVLAEVKGRRPVWGVRARQAVLESHGYHTVVFRSADWAGLHPRLGYQRIFKGDDWAGTDRAIPAGVELVLLPRTEGVSTTLLRQAAA